MTESPSKHTLDLLALLDELRIIAENGLEYADDPYDQERYERIQELVDAYELPPGTAYDPHGAITLVYRCRPAGSELDASHEATALAWQRIDDVDDWFFDHEQYARDALAAGTP